MQLANPRYLHNSFEAMYHEYWRVTKNLYPLHDLNYRHTQKSNLCAIKTKNTEVIKLFSNYHVHISLGKYVDPFKSPFCNVYVKKKKGCQKNTRFSTVSERNVCFVKLWITFCLESERRLQKYLFQEMDYVPSIRPVLNRSDAVQVTLDLAIQQIISVVSSSSFLNTNRYEMCRFPFYILPTIFPTKDFTEKIYNYNELFHQKESIFWTSPLILR